MEPPRESGHTERLVHQARATGREGFAELYGHVAPALYSWGSLNIRGALARDIDPEDLLQEVACRAFEGFQRYAAEQASFRAWVFGVARNVLRGALERIASGTAGHPRDESEDSVSELLDEATTITRRVARDEDITRFLERVNELPEEDRQLVIYRGLEGLPHDEVGKLLGITSQGSAKRWQRLRERLRASYLED